MSHFRRTARFCKVMEIDLLPINRARTHARQPVKFPFKALFKHALTDDFKDVKRHA